MSKTCISQTALHCGTGGSDKLYVVHVEEEAGTYEAVAYNGRRGSRLTRQRPKYTGPSLSAATLEADSMVRGKMTGSSSSSVYSTFTGTITGLPAMSMALGSTPTTPTAPIAPAPASPAGSAATGPEVMLAKPIAELEVSGYLTNSAYGAQRKHDGERITIELSRAHITAYVGRSRVERPLPSETLVELTDLLLKPDFNLSKRTLLDGELVGTQFYAFDLIYLRDNDMRSVSCEERYSSMELLLKDKPEMLSTMAFGTEAKQELYAKSKAENWEGLIIRDLDAMYVPGRGGQLLKCKYWASCTARVMAVNAQRSIKVGLLDEHGDDVFMGNVTVPVNQEVPVVDSLVEVRYLYAHEGGSLYQPTLIGVRTDLSEADLRSSVKLAPPEKVA